MQAAEFRLIVSEHQPIRRLFACGRIAPLPVLLHRVMPLPQEAPYIAGATLTAITVILSILGHSDISFRQKST